LNGRIQVEHPVTEAVTGLDLVAEQLRVAVGEPTPATSDEPGGHAVEARLYAEDPRTFLPQAGRVERLLLPDGDGVRVDAGIEEGDEIGLAYDPLLAKIVVRGRNRGDALTRLAAALAETEVSGVTTNLQFLRWLVHHPVVQAGEATTAFLTEHPPLSPRPPVDAPLPWRSPWRLNLPPPLPAAPPDVDAAALAHSLTHAGSTVTAPMPGTVIRVEADVGEDVPARRALVVLEAMKMEIPVHAPFAGTVTAVHVSPGDQVAGGQLLVELES
jgi:acetyl/propionyl-CoA carboxylase alpha subunit